MKVLRWDLLDTQESRALIASLCAGKKGTALTIGGFDGPHRGHETLFSAVKDAALHSGLSAGIVTFLRSPAAFKKPDSYAGDVSTLNMRLSAFESMKFDFVLLIDFSGDFGRMSGGVFFDILVKTVCMRYVAVGPDFRCGHRLDTGAAEISAIARREGFRFDSIQQVELDGQRISSSAVRKAIQSADFSLAERLLGHPFLLDFTEPLWKVSGSGLEAPMCSFMQILPRRGTYPVVLSTIHGKLISAILNVADDSVSVGPADGSQSLPSGTEIAAARF